jgi:hypothetical protein
MCTAKCILRVLWFRLRKCAPLTCVRLLKIPLRYDSSWSHTVALEKKEAKRTALAKILTLRKHNVLDSS